MEYNILILKPNNWTEPDHCHFTCKNTLPPIHILELKQNPHVTWQLQEAISTCHLSLHTWTSSNKQLPRLKINHTNCSIQTTKSNSNKSKCQSLVSKTSTENIIHQSESSFNSHGEKYCAHVWFNNEI